MRGHSVTHAGPNGVQPIGLDSMSMMCLQPQRTHLRHYRTCASEAYLISENLSNKSYNRERTKTIMLTHIHGYYIYLPRIVWDHACITLLQLKSQRGRGAVLRVAWHTDMVSRFESADMFAITFTKTKNTIWMSRYGDFWYICCYV